MQLFSSREPVYFDKNTFNPPLLMEQQPKSLPKTLSFYQNTTQQTDEKNMLEITGKDHKTADWI